MRSYLDRLIRGLEPWSFSRPLVNFVPPDEAVTPEQLKTVYGQERYELLARIKKRYDPENIFRINHNISPASPTFECFE